jgi:hypothetical protein
VPELSRLCGFLAGWLLLAVPGAPGAGRDAGANRDDGPPPWVPRSRPVDVTDQASYPLRRAGDGYSYDTPRFQARIARDGVVIFKDKRVSFSLAMPKALRDLPRPRGPTLESTLRDLRGKRRREPPPEEPAAPPPFERRLEPSEACPPSSPCHALPPTNAIEVGGSFDLTDEIMRSLGQDPYRYEKARFLSATFEFRIKMAIAAHKADLKAALVDLPRRLDDLWGDVRYTPRERRRILYELWYETDRTKEGERAARAIDEFIRNRLPCGSPEGYSKAELEAFDRLHPERRFPAERACEPAVSP